MNTNSTVFNVSKLKELEQDFLNELALAFAREFEEDEGALFELRRVETSLKENKETPFFIRTDWTWVKRKTEECLEKCKSGLLKFDEIYESGAYESLTMSNDTRGPPPITIEMTERLLARREAKDSRHCLWHELPLKDKFYEVESVSNFFSEDVAIASKSLKEIKRMAF